MMSNESFFENKMKTFFTRFDSDYNDKLEKDDFKAWALRLADLGKLDKSKTDQLVVSLYNIWDTYFLPADVNRDGSVEFPELLNYMKQVLYNNTDANKSKVIKESLPLIFEAIDTDSNGEITSNEFSLYFASLGVTNTQFSNEVFRAMDMNSDGSLSKKENNFLKEQKMPVEVTVNGKKVELKPLKVTKADACNPPPPEVADILKEVSELLGKAAGK